MEQNKIYKKEYKIWLKDFKKFLLSEICLQNNRNFENRIFLVKILNVVENRNCGHKFKFCQKSKFCSKIEMLIKSGMFGQNVQKYLFYRIWQKTVDFQKSFWPIEKKLDRKKS